MNDSPPADPGDAAWWRQAYCLAGNDEVDELHRRFGRGDDHGRRELACWLTERGLASGLTTGLLRLFRLLRIMRLGGGGEMPGRTAGAIRPGDADAEIALRAARRIGDYLTAHPGADPVRIQGELAGDDVLVVPRQAAVMLAQILGFLANGRGVTVTPSNAMLTTQQAADFLNVSRPYLIKLLEAGEIPFEMVGTHRRVAFAALMEYKRRDDQERRRAADELTELGQELGEL